VKPPTIVLRTVDGVPDAWIKSTLSPRNVSISLRQSARDIYEGMVSMCGVNC